MLFSLWIWSVCLMTNAVAKDLQQVVFLDMTHIFDETTQYWGPGTQYPPTLDDSIAEGDLTWYYQNFCVGEHVGTHIDAPTHLRGGDPDKWDLREIPLDRLTGPGIRIDVREKIDGNVNYGVTVDDITEFEAEHGMIPLGAIVFMCSGYDRYWNDSNIYWGGDPTIIGAWNFPGFTAEAAEFLVQQRQVYGLGVDTASLDVGNSPDFAAHFKTLEERVWVLENVKATCDLPPMGSTIYSFPLNIRQSTGFPTRVVAKWQPLEVEKLEEGVKAFPGVPYAELLGNGQMRPAGSYISLIMAVAIVLLL